MLRITRFITLFLAALTTGMGLCHVLEMPARMTWDQQLWVGSTVHGGLYRLFGNVGAVIVVATVIAALVLTWMVRGSGRAVWRTTALGAFMFCLALAGWWAMVFPVNVELAGWLDGPVPRDWAEYRLRWETGHAVNTLAQAIGLGLLYASVLLDTPRSAG